MKSTKVIYVKHERSLRNRISKFMHEIGLFKVVHESRIGSGAIMTVKGGPATLFVLDKMYSKEVALREPFKIR